MSVKLTSISTCPLGPYIRLNCKRTCNPPQTRLSHSSISYCPELKSLRRAGSRHHCRLLCSYAQFLLGYSHSGRRYQPFDSYFQSRSRGTYPVMYSSQPRYQNILKMLYYIPSSSLQRYPPSNMPLLLVCSQLLLAALPGTVVFPRIALPVHPLH